MSSSSFWLASYMNTIFLLCLAIGFPNIATARHHHGNKTDQLALLTFMSSITHDPFRILSSWNESIHFCQWHGVTCGRKHQRVIVLELSHQKLTGSISPYVGNLSFLGRLHLQNNSLSHVIPEEIGRLQRLKYLWLYNNSFGGTIPTNISACSNLVEFDVSRNKLVGKIPMVLGFLFKLRLLSLRFNNLTGTIPSSLGNLSCLVQLTAGYNGLVGNIPNDLGQLSNVEFFGLGVNNLSGTIPSTVFNLSSIKIFKVTLNQIQGSLPLGLGISLPNLEYFSITGNQFTGSIPVSMSNMSNLAYLEVAKNNLIGNVPNFDKLNKLHVLSVHNNHLGSLEVNDLSFISSLTNATDLHNLDLSYNNFGGLLPDSFANISTKLVELWMEENLMYGNILSGITNFINLTRIHTRSNRFTGNIPANIGKLQNLVILDLSQNRFSGIIPSSLGNLSQMNEFYLSDNNFQGSIPSSLGLWTNLLKLDLSKNNFSGTIPRQIFGVLTLSFLYLYQNQINGSLPMEIGSLRNLEALNVSGNLLSGKIPSTLGSCVRLEYLIMRGNFFEGAIPSSLSTLTGIQHLDLSLNNLSGQIPEYLVGFRGLQYLNLSFNNLEGLVPKGGIFKNASAFSVNGNPKLCGDLPELQLLECNFKHSKKKGLPFKFKLMASIIFGLLGLSLVVGFLFFCFLKRRTKQEPPSNSARNSLLELSYQSLLRATNGFSSSNLIGVGSYGSVFKGVLDHDGMVVAVKVFDLLHHGASRSFIAECEALKNIRHRNLVKVLSACSGVDFQGNDFKALLYEFMINGSLEEWLHPNTGKTLAHGEPRMLNLLQRLNIAIDVACALDYLHYHCQTPIVHCDIKPSNILLDKELVGHVGDFGLARFLLMATQNFSSTQTSSSCLRGTLGYTAPEYGMGSEISTYGDVYSFGILLLEMFTRKRPTDEMFKDAFNLHNFAEVALPDRVVEIVDPILLHEIEEGWVKQIETTDENSSLRKHRIQDCLISVLRVGIVCSANLAGERMNINDAAAKLQSIRNFIIGTGIQREAISKIAGTMFNACGM